MENHVIRDDDLHFVIDPDTRVIVNNSSKTKLMQYDHNSETCTFEIPRFVEGHDMSKCTSIQIHYLNTGSGTSSSVREVNAGVYEIRDPQVTDDDKLIFTWLITQNATTYAGTLKFQIRFRCVHLDKSDDYYDEYVWNTDIYSSIEIAPSVDNSGAIYEEYEDVLNQWKMDVDHTLNTWKTEIKEEVSNALKDKAIGDTVQINVSPLPHTVVAKVKTKNIIPYPFSGTSGMIDDVMVTVNDDQTVTFNGTPSKNTSFALASFNKKIPAEKGKTYTIRHTGTFGGSHYAVVSILDASASIIQTVRSNANGVTFVAQEDGIFTIAYVFIANQTLDNVTSAIQLEEGYAATSISPYVDPTKVTLTVYGADKTNVLRTFEPSEDCMYKMESISPTMVLSTDTTGALIEVDYNQDLCTFKENVIDMITQLKQAIIELGGTA